MDACALDLNDALTQEEGDELFAPLPASLISDVRSRVKIYAVASRFVPKWDARRGKAGDHWAPCPLHAEKTASFHVDDARNRFNCFGCHAKGDVIELYQLATRTDFRRAVLDLAADHGVKVDESPKAKRERKRSEREAARLLAEDCERRKQDAANDWLEVAPISAKDPVGGVYLPIVRSIPADTIAALRNVRWGVDKFGGLIMRVRAFNARGEPAATQTTLLKRDGSGKRPTEKLPNARYTRGLVKQAVAPLFALDGPTLAIAEGPETAMSFRALYGVPTWAALGTAQLAAFTPPEGVKHIIIAADNGAGGEAAAHVGLGVACLAFTSYSGKQGVATSEGQRWAPYDAKQAARDAVAKIEGKIEALAPVPLSDEQGRAIGPVRTAELGKQRADEVTRLTGLRTEAKAALDLLPAVAKPADKMPADGMTALAVLIASLELLGFFTIAKRKQKAATQAADAASSVVDIRACAQAMAAKRHATA